jgi:hypothetical protein
MANLTDRMPLTQGTVGVYNNPANPSAIGAVADFATEAVSGYVQLRRDESERLRSQRAAADKKETQAAAYDAIKGYGQAVDVANTSAQQQQQIQQASDAAASPLTQLSAASVDLPTQDGGVFTVPAVAPDAVEKNATRAGRDIQNVVAAVDQGRMPPISLKAALNGKFNQLLDQHPTQAENILDIWKKMGIDTTLFREGKDLGDQLDFQREQGQASQDDDRKFMQKAYEVASKPCVRHTNSSWPLTLLT